MHGLSSDTVVLLAIERRTHPIVVSGEWNGRLAGLHACTSLLMIHIL